MAKLDLKTKHKTIYKQKKMQIVKYPELRYIALKGEGAPSSDLFQEAVAALFATAYTISMSYKGDFVIEDFENFVVSPLEGVWDIINIEEGFDGTNKDNLKWNIMIAMPDFVTEEVLLEAKKRAFSKKGIPSINNIQMFYSESKAYCVGLHIGSYDDEPETFTSMEQFAVSEGFKRSNKTHREIYLSDFRKVEEDKLKTILCFEVIKV